MAPNFATTTGVNVYIFKQVKDEGVLINKHPMEG